MCSVLPEIFQATLAQPLNFGHVLEIGGKVKSEADSIKINLGELKTTRSANIENICLQIHLDLRQKQILFYQYDSQGNGNNTDPIKILLADFIKEFKFYIMLAETKFHIALNNKKLIKLEYNYELDRAQIRNIDVIGKLEYVKQFDHHKYFPYVWPPLQMVEDSLDFSNNQPMAFEPGHVITITANLLGNPKGRFIIHFRHARDNKRQELHVSVRFDTKKLVRNTKYRLEDDNVVAFGKEEVDDLTFTYARFGQEEIDCMNVFPFKDFSKPFKLAIALTESKFRFAKDGDFLFDFSYRSPNILPYITGPKIFGIDGMQVRVWKIEHFKMEDKLAHDFVKYSE